MSIVNISVDTVSRQAVLTVDGIMVPAIACHLSKGVDFDGQPFLSLSYVIEVENGDGLTERREFFLPSQDDTAVFADIKDGLASRIVGDKIDEATADIIRFMQSRKTKK